MRTSSQFLCAIVLTGLAFSAPQQQSSQPAQSAQPSLGDLARQDKAASKPKAKRVITDDDIDRSASASAPADTKSATTAAGDASAASDASKPASATGEAAKAEGTDAAAATDAKKDAATPDAKSKAEQLAQLKKDQDSYKSIIQQLEAKVANTTDQNTIDTFTEVIGRTQQKIIDGQKQIDALEHPTATAPPR